MKWVAKIYRGDKIAKIPIDGAETSQEVRQMAEEIIKKEPGVLNWDKAENPPPFDEGTRFKKIKGKIYVIIIEQTG